MTEIYIDAKFAFLKLLSIFCDLVVSAFEYGARGCRFESHCRKDFQYLL